MYMQPNCVQKDWDNDDFNTLRDPLRYITLIFDQATVLQNSFMSPSQTTTGILFLTPS